MTRPTRRHQRLLIGVATLGAALAALVAVPALPAFAAPIARPDSYAVTAGGSYALTPIANDGKTFLSSGDLTLCGIAEYEANRIYLEQSGDTVIVEIRQGVSGETKINYEVCQGSERRTGVITLTVTRFDPVKAVKKSGVAGQVVFTNPNAVAMTVVYGSAESGKPDKTVTVPASGTLTVPTRRKSLYWVAQFVPTDPNQSTIFVSDAIVKNVQSRR